MGLRGARATPHKPGVRRMTSWRPSAVSDPTNAERQRRWRDRQRNGTVPITVELDEADLETLVLARCLDGRADYVTPGMVAEALRSFLRLSRNA